MNDTEQHDLELQESVQAVMEELPPFLREYLAQGQYIRAVGRLATEYRLTDEQRSILQRETMLLLMGIETPSGAAASLMQEAGVEDKMIPIIMGRLNTEMFVPLRGQLQKQTSSQSAGAAAAQDPLLQTQAARQTVPPPQVQLPIYSAPPLQSPRYVRAEDEVIAFKTAPPPPKAAMLTAAPTSMPPAVPAINVAAKSQSEPLRVEAAPERQALPVGEEVLLAAAQPALAAPQPGASVPVPAAAPAQPSLAPAEPKLRLAEPEALAPQPKVFVTPPVPVRPPSADDPYREPIDQI
ncbi:MAG: hypothetical protein WC030_01740 [Candidatus Paceibacterota bacterium]